MAKRYPLLLKLCMDTRLLGALATGLAHRQRAPLRASPPPLAHEVALNQLQIVAVAHNERHGVAGAGGEG